MTNVYETGTDLVSSSISGGRLHHVARPLVHALETYNYNVSYGENFHKLSGAIFGSDKYYWILADINKARNVLNFTVGEEIKLPIDLEDASIGTEKFFD